MPKERGTFLYKDGNFRLWQSSIGCEKMEISVFGSQSVKSPHSNIVLSVSPFQVVAPVCHQLFDFFCSKTPELRYFSIGMIPMLLSTYLIVIGHSDKKVRILKVGLYRICLVRILCQRHPCSYVEPGGCHGS